MFSAQYDVDSYTLRGTRTFELPSSFVKEIAVTADVAEYYRPVESFDRIWVVEYSADAVTFEDRPQQLLFGDAKR